MRRFTREEPAVLAAPITLGLDDCGDDGGADVRNVEGDAGTGTGTGTESDTGTS